MNDADNSNEKIIHNDFNSKNYQRIVFVFNFESDSKLKTKNDR